MKNKMRIGVDASCWVNQRGYGRFARCLLLSMIENFPQHEFIFFIDSESAKGIQFPSTIKVIEAKTKNRAVDSASAESRRSLSDLWAMSLAVSRCHLDVLIFPSNYSYFPVLTSAKVVLGIHDIIAEEYPDLVFPDRKMRFFWDLKSLCARQQAHHIFTVSEHARKGILRKFRVKPERISVVDEAPDSAFRRIPLDALDASPLRKFGLGESDQFFLYVGGINPHKNLPALMAALAILMKKDDCSARLVVIGDIKNDSFSPGLLELRKAIAENNVEDRVIFTGFLPDEDTAAFMNSALALVLPSFAEGFGLPAVEAAACGTAVIATVNSPLPLLLAGGGVFVNPESVDEIYSALELIYYSPKTRAQMQETAYNQANRLNWRNSANQLMTTLERLLEK
jgi:glycosyltransferase involved in cell wall biosynthesis